MATWKDRLDRPLEDRSDIICDSCDHAILASEKKYIQPNAEIYCEECHDDNHPPE